MLVFISGPETSKKNGWRYEMTSLKTLQYAIISVLLIIRIKFIINIDVYNPGPARDMSVSH